MHETACSSAAHQQWALCEAAEDGGAAGTARRKGVGSETSLSDGTAAGVFPVRGRLCEGEREEDVGRKESGEL